MSFNLPFARKSWLFRTLKKPFRNGHHLQLDVLEDRCTPATLIVNSNADAGVIGDAFLTLREALNVVNGQSTAGLSPQELAQISGSLGNNDAIRFAAGGLDGGQTINLGSALAPTQNVAITGLGSAPVSIIGTSTRAILLNPSPATSILIQGLTLRGTSNDGGVGGAIRNNAGSTLTLTIDSCTISGTNQNEWGGALGNRNNSNTTVINSTITNATSASNGGAIDVQGGTVTLINCTVVGNSAPSGAGGGIIVEGGATLNLRNTIVAGNSDSSGANDITNSGGTINAQNSLIQNVSVAAINGTNTGNITGQGAMLAPLGNNGGLTQTMALLPSSPAINGGNNALATAAGLTKDQRGQTRFVGTVDIGSYELAAPTITTVTSNASGGLTYGQSVTFTATVSTVGAGEPSGTVELFDGATSLGTGVPGATGVNNTTWTFTTSALHAGSHSITAVYTPAASSSFLSSNNNGAPLPLSVAPTALTVSAIDSSKTYGEANPTFTVTFGSFVNGENSGVLGGTLNFITTATQSSDAGDYSVTPAGLASSDYNLLYTPATLTIGKADQAITWADPASIVYGTYLSGAQLNASVSVVGPSPAGAATYTPDLGTVLHAGTGQDLTVNVAGTMNYNPAQATVHIDVTPAALTVTTDDSSKTYGDPNPAFTASFGSFENGDDSSVLGGSLFFTTTATQSSDAGNYGVTPSGLTSSDYTITFAPGTLNIGKATLTVTANDATRFISQANPAFTASYSAFANGDTSASLDGTLAIATTAVDFTSPAGTYPITPSGLTSANYDITFAEGTLTVNQNIQRTVYGAGPGGAPRVVVTDSTNHQLFSFFAYASDLRTGVIVASADVNGDGTEDIITAAGLGGGPQVNVFDGTTGAATASFFAYDSAFRGGVWVAAGQINGRSVIVTGAGDGGSPLVRVFDATTRDMIGQFMAGDPNSRSGIRVSLATDNGVPIIVTACGLGAGSTITVFNAATMTALKSWQAYEPTFTGGAYVAVGQAADGSAVIAIGPGGGGGPRLRVYDGQGNELSNSFDDTNSLRNGLTVVVLPPISVGGGVTILTGAGDGVRSSTLNPDGTLSPGTPFDPFGSDFSGGIFVG